MARGGQKRCRYCGCRFIPDVRVGERQKACSPACQKMRKRENNRIYRARNPDYRQGHYEQYIKPWRQRHPDYQRNRRGQTQKSSREIKAERVKQAMGLIEKSYLCLCEIKAEMLDQAYEIQTERFQMPSVGS